MPTPELVEHGARAIAQFIQPVPYDDLPPHRKAVTPRAEWGQADIREVFEAALKAHEEWLAEQGLVVVPREPTDEQLAAAKNYPGRAFYQNMITAALAEE